MFRSIFNRLLSAALLLAFVCGTLSPSYALYNDQTRKYLPRFINEQVVQYYRFTLNWNDPNISTGQVFGAIGANAYILSIDADVTTAFNATSTNAVTIGYDTTANEIVDSSTANGKIAGTSSIATGILHLTAAVGLGVAVTGVTANQQGGGVVPAYVPLYAKYAQTGTAASAGSVTIIIAYISNNDM